MHERGGIAIVGRLLALAAGLALVQPVGLAALEPAAELFGRADAERNVGAALKILEAGLPGLSAPADRMQVLARAAALFEALSDVSGAQSRYEQAYSALPTAESRPHLLRSAELLFEMGEYQKSEEQARLVTAQTGGAALKKRAITLIARLMQRTGRAAEAVRIIRELLALADGQDEDEGLLLFAVELGLDQADKPMQDQALEKLKKYFPDSPDRQLAMSLVEGKPGLVSSYPVPSRIFPSAAVELRLPGPAGVPPAGRDEKAPVVSPAPAGPVEKAPVVLPAPPAPTGAIRAIQLGSFTVEENARYLVRDLAAKGIKAVIGQEKRGNKSFHQVLVPLEAARRGPDEAQQELLRLKDKGFEGFFVFERP